LGGFEHYNRIIATTDGVDPVTQDMVIAIPSAGRNATAWVQ
jgi:hypothetical protein